MKKSHLNLLLVLLSCMTSINVLAYCDIQVPNADGVTIYYNVNYLENAELEVTSRDYNKSSYS